MDPLLLVPVEFVNVHGDRHAPSLLSSLIENTLEFRVKLDFACGTWLLRSSNDHAFIIVHTRIDIDLQLLVDVGTVLGAQFVSESLYDEVLGEFKHGIGSELKQLLMMKVREADAFEELLPLFFIKSLQRQSIGSLIMDVLYLLVPNVLYLA